MRSFQQQVYLILWGIHLLLVLEWMNKEQKKDMELVFHGMERILETMDYVVTAWYKKCASDYIQNRAYI